MSQSSTAALARYSSSSSSSSSQPEESYPPATVQYLPQASVRIATSDLSAPLYLPTSSGCSLLNGPVPAHIALVPVLPPARMSASCNTTVQAVLAKRNGAIAAAWYLPAGANASDLASINSNGDGALSASFATVDIPLFFLVNQSITNQVVPALAAMNLATPVAAGSVPRIDLTLPKLASVGLSSGQVWTWIVVVVAIVLGAGAVTSGGMHAHQWRAKQQMRRKAFARAVAHVEDEDDKALHSAPTAGDSAKPLLLPAAGLSALPIISFASAVAARRSRRRHSRRHSRVSATTSQKRLSVAGSTATAGDGNGTRRHSRVVTSPTPRPHSSLAVRPAHHRMSVASLLGPSPLASTPEARAARDRRRHSTVLATGTTTSTSPPALDAAALARMSVYSAASILRSAPQPPASLTSPLLPTSPLAGSATLSPTSPTSAAAKPVAPSAARLGDRLIVPGSSASAAAAAARERPVSVHFDAIVLNSIARDGVAMPRSAAASALTGGNTDRTGFRRHSMLFPAASAMDDSDDEGDEEDDEDEDEDDAGQVNTKRPVAAGPFSAPATRTSFFGGNNNSSSKRPVSGISRLSASSSGPKQQNRASVLYTVFPMLPGAPAVEADNDDDVNDSCPVCVEAYVAADRVRELPCGHVFHVHCADAWLTTREGSCPLCGVDVVGWWRAAYPDLEVEEAEADTPSASTLVQAAAAATTDGPADAENDLGVTNYYTLPSTPGAIPIVATTADAFRLAALNSPAPLPGSTQPPPPPVAMPLSPFSTLSRQVPPGSVPSSPLVMIDSDEHSPSIRIDGDSSPEDSLTPAVAPASPAVLVSVSEDDVPSTGANL
ncbi:hypothetical protein BC828DRAFT_387814 [Blastocladiella britannica]|nr:hypothetical protein BC828DRAFT_387814 [Blastocladiella britannica]